VNKLMILAAMLCPSVAMAQDEIADFKADAAPYVKMGVTVGAARQCGLRSLDWGADAEQAISDELDGFATNLWGNTTDPAPQKAESDAELDLNIAENTGEDYRPSQCSHLDDDGALSGVDNLIMGDSNITDATTEVPNN
jgi:hypothetical protein